MRAGWRPVQKDSSELHHSANLRQQGGEVPVQVVNASSHLGQEILHPLCSEPVIIEAHDALPILMIFFARRLTTRVNLAIRSLISALVMPH